MSLHHPNLAYRPEVDALRTIAVLPVILFHGGVELFSGGYVGVDVFFVISGYLITSILIRDLEQDRFSILRFYDRRIRRIFPALIVVILFVLVVGWFVMLPKDYEDTGQSALAAATFLSNILFYLKTGYFAGPAETKALLHTWSLAVEEQFYVFFPLFLWVVWRLGRRWLLATFAATALLSFILMLVAMPIDTSFAFYMFPTRAWELLLGSMLAVAPAYRPLADLFTALGLALIGYAIFAFDANTVFPGWAAVPPAVGAALVIHFSPDARLTAALRWRPLVFIGLISYSLYLWHWPILVFMRYWAIRPLNAVEIGIAIALTFLAAWLSWRFVERPFRTMREVPAWKMVAGGIGAAAVPAAMGLAVALLAGLPQRLSPEVLQIVSAKDYRPTKADGCEPIKGLAAGSVCVLGDPAIAPSFAIWGDSHAGSWRAGADAAARRHGVSGLLFTANGCPPVIGLDLRDATNNCARYTTDVLERLAAAEVHTVMLSARWAAYERAGRVRNGDGSHATWSSLVEATIREIAQQRRVVFLRTVPGSAFDVPAAQAQNVMFGKAVDLSVSRRELAGRDTVLAPLLQELVSENILVVLDPADALCEGETCPAVIDGVPQYSDESHLSEPASVRAGTVLDALLETAATSPLASRSAGTPATSGEN